MENEASRVLLLHYPGADVDVRENFCMEVGALAKESAKVRPDCLLSLGENRARIVLYHGVRAKAAHHPVHVPRIKRVDEVPNDLDGVHMRLLYHKPSRFH